MHLSSSEQETWHSVIYCVFSVKRIKLAWRAGIRRCSSELFSCYYHHTSIRCLQLAIILVYNLAKMSTEVTCRTLIFYMFKCPFYLSLELLIALEKLLTCNIQEKVKADSVWQFVFAVCLSVWTEFENMCMIDFSLFFSLSHSLSGSCLLVFFYKCGIA